MTLFGHTTLPPSLLPPPLLISHFNLSSPFPPYLHSQKFGRGISFVILFCLSSLCRTLSPCKVLHNPSFVHLQSDLCQVLGLLWPP